MNFEIKHVDFFYPAYIKCFLLLFILFLLIGIFDFVSLMIQYSYLKKKIRKTSEKVNSIKTQNELINLLKSSKDKFWIRGLFGKISDLFLKNYTNTNFLNCNLKIKCVFDFLKINIYRNNSRIILTSISSFIASSLFFFYEFYKNIMLGLKYNEFINKFSGLFIHLIAPLFLISLILISMTIVMIHIKKCIFRRLSLDLLDLLITMSEINE